ncbi:hypothetical protein KAU33_08890 [Candidatus Dependentiae bacterium]|nr:hypothetical protein [Candidatus Dependentiae bacterium]
MSEQLAEAEKILAEKKMLLKKYPYKFSLQWDVRQWSEIVSDLERDKTNGSV